MYSSNYLGLEETLPFPPFIFFILFLPTTENLRVEHANPQTKYRFVFRSYMNYNASLHPTTNPVFGSVTP